MPAKKTSRPKTAPGKTGKPRKKTARKKTSPAGIFWWVLAAVVLIAAAAIYISPRSAETWDYGAAIPHSVTGQFGIDISHNNSGHIDWAQLMVLTDSQGRTIKDLEAAAEVRPISFAFIKATEGQEMVDRNFQNNWAGAGEHGIERGAYHFFRTSKDPARQAQNFIRTVGELQESDLPPVLDIETTHKGLKRKQLNKSLQVWLDMVEKHYGRKPIIYTYDSFASDWLSDDILDNYPVWIAHYEADSPIFRKWKYWQFTDKALVYGVEGKVDLSIRRR